MPVPFAKSLESGYVVTVEKIVKAVRRTLA
jgi:hypothetical protein